MAIISEAEDQSWKLATTSDIETCTGSPVVSIDSSVFSASRVPMSCIVTTNWLLVALATVFWNVELISFVSICARSGSKLMSKERLVISLIFLDVLSSIVLLLVILKWISLIRVSVIGVPAILVSILLSCNEKYSQIPTVDPRRNGTA